MLLDTAGFCPKHDKQQQQQQDERRGTAHERGYNSAWTRARAHYLRAHPLCVYCQREGMVCAASVVDHIKPHRLKEALDSGIAALIVVAKALFWDSENNWQSLCGPCHNRIKQSEEKASRK